MKPVFYDSGAVELRAKEKFNFPELIMMENASCALEKAVLKKSDENTKLLILCGGGNNGADGLALARRTSGMFPCDVYLYSAPKTKEAKIQFKMLESCAESCDSSCAIKIIQKDEIDSLLVENYSIIVDCLYGTGFHGSLPFEILSLFEKVNKTLAYKIACDVPSGFDKDGNGSGFSADETVTMGSLKFSLYTDFAKDFTGKITVSNLGIPEKMFEQFSSPDAFLLDEKDAALPVRTKKSCHKGNFGHAAVICGEKKGAAIIAGSACLKTGAGFVSLISDTEDQLLINPELMINKNLPENTTAVLLGSGLGRSDFSFEKADIIKKQIILHSLPVVLDADIFYHPQIAHFLQELNEKNIKTVLTPHPKELYELCSALNFLDKAEISFSDFLKRRFEFAKKLSSRFENIVLVSKSAVNYIFSQNKAFICDLGTEALAKAGSGDVLAGLCVSLLAQNYSSKDAAVTAVLMHSESSRKFINNWELTPLSLIEKLNFI